MFFFVLKSSKYSRYFMFPAHLTLDSKYLITEFTVEKVESRTKLFQTYVTVFQ